MSQAPLLLHILTPEKVELKTRYCIILPLLLHYAEYSRSR